jgi:hypothetical protein
MPWGAFRAPRGQMPGAATQAMPGHRRGAVRRRAVVARGLPATLGLLVAAAVALGACTGRRPPVVVPAQPAPESPPWQVPPQALATQRLFRMSYSGPEGEGSFRVTLRLATGSRFQIQAVDPLGRSLWTLDADGGRDLWLDHRNRVYCRPAGRMDLPGLPLGSFALAELPALLLGRLPAEPPPDAPPKRQGDQLTFEDLQGRRWTATLADGTVRAWTLWEGGEPAAWWAGRDGGGGGVLSVRAARGAAGGAGSGVQVRWREVLAEKLTQEPAPLAPPKGFRELASCLPGAGPARSGSD